VQYLPVGTALHFAPVRGRGSVIWRAMLLDVTYDSIQWLRAAEEKLRYMKTMLKEVKWKEVKRMKRIYKKENERDRRIRRRKRRNLPWSRESFTFITNLIHLLPQGGTQMQLNLSENLMRQFPPSLGWRVCMVDGFRFPINPTRSRPDSLLLRRLRLIGWRHWSGFYFFLNEFFVWSI
jgi:hypothetical protein